VTVQTRDQQEAAPPSPRRAVRVAWSQFGADFNDMLREGRSADIAASIDDPRVLMPVAVAQSPAERSSEEQGADKSGVSERGVGSDHAAARESNEGTNNGGEPPDVPNDLGYDVEVINKEYAIVKVGSQTVIYQENSNAREPEHRLRMLTIQAFRNWFANRFTYIRGYDGRIKRVSWAVRWLQDPRRRQYEGLEFYPDPYDAPGSQQFLNLWTGFDVRPAPNPDWINYKTFRDHLLNNVCDGDEVIFKWLFAFLAHIIQRPRERLGIALVLRGRRGAGKTKVGEVIGALFKRHWFLVDSARYVTGQFNAHMASCLMLQADEAVWAGDKAAEGRIKGLITAPIQFIEAKGVDPVPLANYVRLMLTSNEDWVVPAGKDERRFVVLDINPRCAKNATYFAELDAEMAAGGLEHLLGDLLAFDLSTVDLRNFPRTEALLEQKMNSLSPIDSWWADRLMSGTTTRDGDKWERVIPTDKLFEDYVAVSDQLGIKRKNAQISFGSALKKLMPKELKRDKHTTFVGDARGQQIKRRVSCYFLPSLAEARAQFEKAVEQKIDWPPEDQRDVVEGAGDDVVI
jgi:Family of unknown function (DUF5906)